MALDWLIASAVWLCTWTLHAMLAQGAALLSARRLRSARVRDVIWKCALILPIVTATIAVRGIGGTSQRAEWNVAPAFASREQRDRHIVIKQLTLAPDGTRTQRTVAADTVTMRLALAIDVAAALSAVAGALLLVRRRRRFARSLMHRSTYPLPFARRFRISSAADVLSPVAVGWSEVVLPANVSDRLSEVELRSVLAHEEAHLQRRDPFTFALADVVVAIGSWHPFARLVANALRRDAEFICDDSAAAAMGEGHSLVRSLAVFAANEDHSWLGNPSMAGSPLELRAERLLAVQPEMGTIGVMLAIAVVVVSAGVLGVAGPRVVLHPRPVAEGSAPLLIQRDSLVVIR